MASIYHQIWINIQIPGEKMQMLQKEIHPLSADNTFLCRLSKVMMADCTVTILTTVSLCTSFCLWTWNFAENWRID